MGLGQLGSQAAGVCAEAGAETYEPEIAAVGAGLFFAEGFFECEEDRRAAHVTVVTEYPGAGV